ncbi:unnamed protein product [Strongylus vulgaris]|uniref:Uncharacterized protein n=1 Tax=Strongylus vulgaris TaxID=40348 RepID=A0A3P7LHX8_STRVU|nr:unnamed protein product [Strongylus vulgaris]
MNTFLAVLLVLAIIVSKGFSCYQGGAYPYYPYPSYPYSPYPYYGYNYGYGMPWGMGGMGMDPATAAIMGAVSGALAGLN